MKVAHVVTAITPDGSYGGPLQVALNQIRSLRERGVDALLLGGGSGFEGKLPTTYEGVPCKLFPTAVALEKKYASWFSPGMLLWLVRHAREFDFFHIHLARDSITVPSSHIVLNQRIPFLVQTHGMVTPSDRYVLRMYDSLLTRRILGRASAVAALTTQERSDLLGVLGQSRSIEILGNGVPLPESRSQPGRRKEVLFVGRLHGVKRPMQFVRMAAALAGEFPDYVFTLIGPDEGEGVEVQNALRALNSDQVQWLGPMTGAEVQRYMDGVEVVVCTSARESFGLAIVEAGRSGSALVMPLDLVLAPSFVEHQAAATYDGTLSDLIDTVRALLESPSSMVTMGNSARAMVEAHFDTETITDRLLELYSRT